MTVKNRAALPLIPEILSNLHGKKYFTKIDLREAYYLIRIKEGHEWLTAFRTKYGLFEYRVMPFGLTNAPAAFQGLMNFIFAAFIDDFLNPYLDDILIYSDSLEDHIRHIKIVLNILRKNNLCAKISKCAFHVQKVEFLGFWISTDGISMDPDKIKAVREWPSPKSVKDVQSFLGFANFYRKFIPNFSGTVRPLTDLLKKDKAFKWEDVEHDAFSTLKVLFTSAPVLAHPDPLRPFILETDASDYAISGVLSQYQVPSNRAHPVGFFSRKLTPPECNYDVHDKELLAIVDSFAYWRPQLLGARHPVTVFTDHKNLVYWAISKKLNRRQIRWMQFFAEYDFKIYYRPGSLGGKPDALSRRSDYVLQEDENHVMQQIQALLPIERFGPGFEYDSLVTSETQVPRYPAQNVSNDVSLAMIGPLTPEKTHFFATSAENSDLPENYPDLLEIINTAAANDDEVKKIRDDLPPLYSIKDDFLLFKSKIYVPVSAELKVFRFYHDSPTAGHPGRNRTISTITESFYIPGLYGKVKKYVDECITCSKSRINRQKPAGLLKPLPRPHRPFWSISMDFIVGLPKVREFDSVLVVVCRFSKLAIFIPTSETLKATEFSELLFKHIFCRFGAPNNIISDRGSIFTSHFWSAVTTTLKISHNLSTSHHPQTDGQTERVNQELERYLRAYLNYQMDNWTELLYTAEYAYNSHVHRSTGASPFTVCLGYQPTFLPSLEEFKISDVSSPSAHEFMLNRLDSWRAAKEQLEIASESMKKYADENRRPAEDFNPGDLVYVEAKHLPTTRPSQKLDFRRHGPLKIIKKISSHAYQVARPAAWSKAVHDVFHVSLLSRAHVDPARQGTTAPPPILVNGQIEFVVEQILNEKTVHGKVHYLVKWKDYDETENSWEPAENCANAQDKIKEFKKSRARALEGDTVRAKGPGSQKPAARYKPH